MISQFCKVSPPRRWLEHSFKVVWAILWHVIMSYLWACITYCCTWYSMGQQPLIYLTFQIANLTTLGNPGVEPFQLRPRTQSRMLCPLDSTASFKRLPVDGGKVAAAPIAIGEKRDVEICSFQLCWKSYIGTLDHFAKKGVEHEHETTNQMKDNQLLFEVGWCCQ